MRVILDSNVIYAGLYSSQGASFRVLKHFREALLHVGLSIALYEEYADVLRRPPLAKIYTTAETDEFLNYFCQRATLLEIFYLWRPYLKNPKDDLVLEAAVSFAAEAIITHNIKDFVGSEKFGVRALTPQQYLQLKQKP